jgi:hypothetical protein
MEHSPATDESKIEITQEMILAGIDALENYRLDLASASKPVVMIFIAMIEAAHLSHLSCDRVGSKVQKDAR